jgi:hypothetical protein
MIHSLFGEWKPQRMEDRIKRVRRFSQNGCFPRRSPPLALQGKGGHCVRRKTAMKMNRGLANPTLEGQIQQIGEGQSIGTERRELTGPLKKRTTGSRRPRFGQCKRAYGSTEKLEGPRMLQIDSRCN